MLDDAKFLVLSHEADETIMIPTEGLECLSSCNATLSHDGDDKCPLLG